MVKYLIKDISKGVKLIRLDDDRIRFFEAAWHIPEGITYNAYLIEANEGAILVDTWKAAYSDLFMDVLKEVSSPLSIKYVIVNHAEPDHTGSLPILLKDARDAKVIINVAGERVLKAKYDINNEIVRVEGTKTMNLLGEEISFLHVPWVHWPETMFAYQTRTKIMYTCDVFGSFSIPPQYYADSRNAYYLRSAEKYFTTVMGYYRKYVLNAIEKVRNLKLEISKIAPSHGGVWESDTQEPLKLFESWARAEPKTKNIVVAYVSMYGSVERALSKVSDELGSRGIGLKTTAITDSEYPDLEEFLTDANSSSAIILATPTYDTEIHPRMKFLLELLREKFKGVNKPIVALISYGWGSNAARTMENILRETGMNVLTVESFREKITKEQSIKVADLIEKTINL